MNEELIKKLDKSVERLDTAKNLFISEFALIAANDESTVLLV